MAVTLLSAKNFEVTLAVWCRALSCWSIVHSIVHSNQSSYFKERNLLKFCTSSNSRHSLRYFKLQQVGNSCELIQQKRYNTKRWQVITKKFFRGNNLSSNVNHIFASVYRLSVRSFKVLCILFQDGYLLRNTVYLIHNCSKKFILN